MSRITGKPIASRRFSLPPVGARVMQVAQAAFMKRGFAQGHVIAHWEEIMGAELAAFSMPEKIAFPRGSAKSADLSGGTLTIRVDGPAALEIRHLEPQIIDRINTYYGYAAIGRLKIIQGPLPPKPRPRYRKLRPLRPDERQALGQSLEKIEEPSLRQSLETLGERVLGAHNRR